jgi:small neutral amino acid transporter SnatA (MarC family)
MSKVISRLMGLLLSAIGVQMLVGGQRGWRLSTGN